MFLGLEWSEWLMIWAILLAPLVAVQVSVFLDRRRAANQRKLDIFRALMTTRGSRMAPEHIRALNTIDVEFAGDDADSKKVFRAWKAYLDHLNTPAESMSGDTWLTRSDDLFVNLLHAMSLALGYDYDKTHIRRSAYYPKGYGDQEYDIMAIRRGFREVLEGKRPIPVAAITVEEGEVDNRDLPEPQQLAQPTKQGPSGDTHAPKTGS